MKGFPTSYSQVLERLQGINPLRYIYNRNYVDGAVTRLSPYISRGVISTRQVLGYLLNEKGYDPGLIRKFIQELAWRDYFQQVHKDRKDLNLDLNSAQLNVKHHELPKALVQLQTGIQAIDHAVKELYDTGYMHNHVRMYVASITCNIGQAHWLSPARWLYYHLLDGDWASNALSWQWIAGTFSRRKYYANQENINQYTRSSQRSTFLDHEYSDLQRMGIPPVLRQTIPFEATTRLPSAPPLSLVPDLPVCVYDKYNLDPTWRNNIKANRVLLLEPSYFKNYPVSPAVIQFLLDLSLNIPGIILFVGEFKEIAKAANRSRIYFKEHPSHPHYIGIQDERDWMFPEVKGVFTSFTQFWKTCEPFIIRKP